MNGTLACILYFSFNPHATLFVDGGTIHLNTKRIVYALWAMNLYQYAAVMIAPAVFAVACYTSLTNGSPARYLSNILGDQSSQSMYSYNITYNITTTSVVNNITITDRSTYTNVTNVITDDTSYWIYSSAISSSIPLNWPGFIVLVYLFVYASWVYLCYSYDDKKVKLWLENLYQIKQEVDPETKAFKRKRINEFRMNLFNTLSIFLIIVGVVIIFPVYFALVYGLVTEISTLDIIVIITMFGPVVIALSQSLQSALLYVKYLSWFLVLLIYFLVFLPSYAIAR